MSLEPARLCSSVCPVARLSSGYTHSEGVVDSNALVAKWSEAEEQTVAPNGLSRSSCWGFS